MDDGEGGRVTLNFNEKSFLFEWLVENNKTLTRKNKDLLVENLKFRSRLEELEKINYLDSTTGLHNRWYLQPRLDEEFSRSRRSGSYLSCLFIDIDDFKSCNERHGRFIGDKVLRDAAILFQGLCRKKDVLVRFGGDEYVILLGSSGKKVAMTVAERIRSHFHAHRFTAGDQEITMTVSIGISTLKKAYVASSRDPWEIVWTAEGAMHFARQKGPGQIHRLDCQAQGQKPAESKRVAS